MIGACYGGVGTGKGVFANHLIDRLSTWRSDELQKEGITLEIKTNFDTYKVPHCQKVTIDQFILENREKNIEKIAFIDEPQMWGLESRGSGSLGGGDAFNPSLKQLLSQKAGPQSRKTFGDIFFTTQMASEYEKRDRTLARFILLALSPLPNFFQYWYMGKIEKPLQITKKRAESIWNNYNTYEEIVPTFSPEYQRQHVDDFHDPESSILTQEMITGSDIEKNFKPKEKKPSKPRGSIETITKDGVRIYNN